MNSFPAVPPVCAVLIGASGRMGRAILAVAGEFPQLAFVAAIASQGSAVLGRDSGVLAGGAPNRVALTSDLSQALQRAHVVLDFSGAAATHTNLAACRMARKPLLLGSTGYASELEADLTAAALDIPLLIAPNTSLGVTLLLELARTAARALPAFRCLDHREAPPREARCALRYRTRPRRGAARGPRRATPENPDLIAARRGGRGRAHRAAQRPRRGARFGSSGHRSGDLCPGGSRGRALACAAAGGSLRHARSALR